MPLHWYIVIFLRLRNICRGTRVEGTWLCCWAIPCLFLQLMCCCTHPRGAWSTAKTSWIAETVVSGMVSNGNDLVTGKQDQDKKILTWNVSSQLHDENVSTYASTYDIEFAWALLHRALRFRYICNCRAAWVLLLTMPPFQSRSWSQRAFTIAAPCASINSGIFSASPLSPYFPPLLRSLSLLPLLSPSSLSTSLLAYLYLPSPLSLQSNTDSGKIWRNRYWGGSLVSYDRFLPVRPWYTSDPNCVHAIL